MGMKIGGSAIMRLETHFNVCEATASHPLLKCPSDVGRVEK